jgi:ABC-type transport system substrate-binding protein
VSVLDSIGYRAQLRHPKFNPYRLEDKLGLQVGFFAFGPNYPAPAGFIAGGLSCAATGDTSSDPTHFCDPALDREMARAQALQTTDAVAATNLWAKIDRQFTDAAVWAPFANGAVVEVVSKRVRNYQCNPQWGTLLDQWVK